jgi:hypothetical protein
MIVSELIEILKNYPQDIKVCFEKYSEHRLIEIDDIELVELCSPRPDGWIQNKRLDKETEIYLVFPGN